MNDNYIINIWEIFFFEHNKEDINQIHNLYFYTFSFLISSVFGLSIGGWIGICWKFNFSVYHIQKSATMNKFLPLLWLKHIFNKWTNYVNVYRIIIFGIYI